MVKQVESVEADFQQLVSVCTVLQSRIVELEAQIEEISAQLSSINEEESVQAQKNEHIRKRIDAIIKRLEEIENMASGKEGNAVLPVENKGEMW